MKGFFTIIFSLTILLWIRHTKAKTFTIMLVVNKSCFFIDIYVYMFFITIFELYIYMSQPDKHSQRVHSNWTGRWYNDYLILNHLLSTKDVYSYVSQNSCMYGMICFFFSIYKPWYSDKYSLKKRRHLCTLLSFHFFFFFFEVMINMWPEWQIHGYYLWRLINLFFSEKKSIWN